MNLNLLPINSTLLDFDIEPIVHCVKCANNCFKVDCVKRIAVLFEIETVCSLRFIFVFI